MDLSIDSITMSINTPGVLSPSNVDYLSGLSADEQEDDDEYEHNSPNEKESTSRKNYIYKRGTKMMKQYDDERGESSNNGICERLYHEGMKKEKQRARDIRDKLDQENNVSSPRLKLESRRSYTPMRTRPNNENVHDHLYSLSRKKQIEVEEEKKKDEMETIEKTSGMAVLSPTQGMMVSGRLYQRSRSRQQEGRRLRKQIEKKLAPRAPTPTKKIPLSKATGMYERALAHKAQTERKIEDILNSPRESNFPKMRTQSRPRSVSSSRPRSITPGRQERNKTPTRRRETPNRSRETPTRTRDSSRSCTPSKRKANVNSYNNSYVQKGKGKNILPPTSLKTREQSPDMRA
jgi:hypothetical protein